MANKRKYTEVKGYWVYSIQVPSINKYYIGVSGAKECSQRWIKASYNGTALEPYLNEWQDMIKTVLVDNLNTKKEALIMEDNIIQALQMNDLCINERRSGLIEASDKNAYHRERQKQRYENDVEFRECRKQQAREYRENNKEKIKEKRRKRYLKKKLEKQNQQLNLF